MMQAAGYGTYLVTDNMHQFKPSTIHRGFDVFDFFRGQTTDNHKPAWTYPKDKVDQALLKGNIPAMTGQMRQYFANVKERKTEADWFSPMVFSQAAEYLDVLSKGGPFFLTVDSYDPHEPGTRQKYIEMYDDGPYNLKEPFSVIYGPSSYLLPGNRRMKARYSAEVTMMDRWLGRFLDKMEELASSIVPSSYSLRSRRRPRRARLHGKPDNVLWPEVTDIPFYIRHPEGKGGTDQRYCGSTHDVAPTILGSSDRAAAGVGRPGPHGLARRRGARGETPLLDRLQRPCLGPRRPLRHVQHQPGRRRQTLRRRARPWYAQ